MGNSLCSTWKSRSDFGENWKGAPPFVSRQCFPNIDPGYLILIAVFYQIILFLGGSTFLGGFELVGKVHYFLGLGAKFTGCRLDGEFILETTMNADWSL